MKENEYSLVVHIMLNLHAGYIMVYVWCFKQSSCNHLFRWVEMRIHTISPWVSKNTCTQMWVNSWMHRLWWIYMLITHWYMCKWCCVYLPFTSLLRKVYNIVTLQWEIQLSMCDSTVHCTLYVDCNPSKACVLGHSNLSITDCCILNGWHRSCDHALSGDIHTGGTILHSLWLFLHTFGPMP